MSRAPDGRGKPSPRDDHLVDLVIRIGEMLAYQAYNIKSPLDGEAAMWADLNPTQLPTDPRNIRPAGME